MDGEELDRSGEENRLFERSLRNAEIIGKMSDSAEKLAPARSRSGEFLHKTK